jgi:protein-S-isoprenylcysteine O-methyltransferase Ste14
MPMNAKLVLPVVIFFAVQMGLSIWAFGGFAAFFSHPPLVAVIVVTVVLTIASFFTRGNLSTGEREDRDNRWVLKAFAVLGILSAVVPPYTDRIGFWTIDGETTRWIGVGLLAIGGVIRLWPVFVLGHRFSGLVAIQPGHTLVTTGIYSYIRNPSYLGLIVGALGWGLAFRSIIGVILALLNLVPLIARMDSEEALLRSEFGGEYDAYYARTKRLIPGIY